MVPPKEKNSLLINSVKHPLNSKPKPSIATISAPSSSYSSSSPSPPLTASSSTSSSPSLPASLAAPADTPINTSPPATLTALNTKYPVASATAVQASSYTSPSVLNPFTAPLAASSPPATSSKLSVLDRGAKAIKTSLSSAGSISKKATKKATKKVSEKTSAIIRRHSHLHSSSPSSLSSSSPSIGKKELKSPALPYPSSLASSSLAFSPNTKIINNIAFTATPGSASTGLPSLAKSSSTNKILPPLSLSKSSTLVVQHSMPPKKNKAPDNTHPYYGYNQPAGPNNPSKQPNGIPVTHPYYHHSNNHGNASSAGSAGSAVAVAGSVGSAGSAVHIDHIGPADAPVVPVAAPSAGPANPEPGNPFLIPSPLSAPISNGVHQSFQEFEAKLKYLQVQALQSLGVGHGTSENPIVLNDAPLPSSANTPVTAGVSSGEDVAMSDAPLPVAESLMKSSTMAIFDDNGGDESDDLDTVTETDFVLPDESDEEAEEFYYSGYQFDELWTREGDPGHLYLECEPNSMESFEAIRKKLRILQNTDNGKPRFLSGPKKDSDAAVTTATDELFYAVGRHRRMGDGDLDVMRLSHHVFSLTCQSCEEPIFCTVYQVYDWLMMMIHQRVVASFVQCSNPQCLDNNRAQCVGCHKIEKMDAAPQPPAEGLNVSFCCIKGRLILLWVVLWGLTPLENRGECRKTSGSFTNQEISDMLAMVLDDQNKQSEIVDQELHKVHELQQIHKDIAAGVVVAQLNPDLVFQIRCLKRKHNAQMGRLERIHRIKNAILALQRKQSGTSGHKWSAKKPFLVKGFTTPAAHGGQPKMPTKPTKPTKATKAIPKVVLPTSKDLMPTSNELMASAKAIILAQATAKGMIQAETPAHIGKMNTPTPTATATTATTPPPLQAPSSSSHAVVTPAPSPMGSSSKSTFATIKGVFKKSKPPPKPGVAKGIGYAGAAGGAGEYGGINSAQSNQDFVRIREKQDEKMTAYIDITTHLLPTTQPEDPFGRTPPAIIGSLISRSPLLDTVTDLLSCDSLVDIGDRTPVYLSLICLIRALALHPRHWNFLFETRGRFTHPEGALVGFSLIRDIGLLPKAVADESVRLPCMLTLLNALAAKARQFQIDAKKHKIEDEDGRTDSLVILCREICMACAEINKLHTFLDGMDVEPTSAVMIPHPSIGPVTSKTATEKATIFREWQKENCIQEVEDDKMVFIHHYAVKSGAELHVAPVPGHMKRIVTEIAAMRTSLPEGIIVRYASSRPDLMKILIFGPGDTPYEHGLFEFDLWCTSKYPHEAPRMKFLTTNNGRLRFNPNLYADGKICLSLLGTWEGPRWIPSTSTMLQIFVSIQAMILCENPWYNEPGRELSKNEAACIKYNNSLRKHTLQVAILPWLSNDTSHIIPLSREGIWADVVHKYFEAKGAIIFDHAERWRRKSFSTDVETLKALLEARKYL